MAVAPSTMPAAGASGPAQMLPLSDPVIAAQVDGQLRRTQRQVKGVELTSAMLTLGCGVLAYLLVVAVVDHWFLGMGFVSRSLAFLLLLGGTGRYVARRIVPLIRFGINPVYAAHEIERATPGLKNSLINLLLLRQQPRDLNPNVFRAMESQAAVRLQSLAIDSVVDRAIAIRLAWTLTALIVAFAAYKVFSPKDPFRSIARVLAPWADITPPTRLEIGEILPGDVKLFHGSPLTVSVRVSSHGVADQGPVSIVYSTINRQVVERRLSMNPGDSSGSFFATLPADGRGVQQDLHYRIEAGDARSREFQVQVLPAPIIRVERVIYRYPEYSRLPVETVENQGELRGLEGTLVTLVARSNQPLKSALLEFDPHIIPTATLPMQVRGEEATCAFVMALAPDRIAPKHSSYQIRMITESGNANAEPIVHSIDVTPDLPPELEILTPDRDMIELPEDASQTIEIRGIDPDFGLRKIQLHAVSGGQELLTHDLLDTVPPLAGQTVVSFTFRPVDAGLRAGDEVSYWAMAEDSRTTWDGKPEPNVRRTTTYRIRITAPRETPGDNDDQLGRPTESDPDANAKDPKRRPQFPTEKPEQKPPSKRSDSGEDRSATGDESSSDQDSGPMGGASNGGLKSAGNSKSSDTKSGAGGTGKSPSNNEDDDSGSSAPTGSSTSSGRPKKPDRNSPPSGESGENNADEGNGETKDATQKGNSTNGSNATSNSRPSDSSNDLNRADEPHDGEVFDRALNRLRQAAAKSGTGSNDRRDTNADSGQPNDGSNTNDQGNGDSAKGDSPEGDSAKGDSAKGDSAKGDSAKGDSAKGDSAKGDSAKGDS
ncbi:MAG: hypothetical protein FJ295_21490, partial [Planctomycetes bacterium]|nr:hypothetical protein [Planctomycetota bacterium]